MTNGVAINLQIEPTDPTIPIDYGDELINYAPGALVVVDPIHSLAPWSAGVPGSGSTVPNIAQARGLAASLIGSGDATTLAVPVSASGINGSTAVIERSTKGALHGLWTQTNQVANGAWKLVIPDVVKTFMLANPTDPYYMSLWLRPTRLATLVYDAMLQVVNSTSQLSNLLATITATAFAPTGGALAGSYVSPGFGQLQETLFAIEVTGWTGTAPGSIANLWAELGWGVNGYQGQFNKHGSAIIKRFSLINGRLAGRGFADILAKDKKIWTRDVLTAGGRYYGDTWVTNPSGFP